MPRRREREHTGADASVSTEVPVELLAGPCIEVWTDRAEGADWPSRAVSTFRRYHDARRAWLEAHGVGHYDRDGVPPPLEHGTGSARVYPWSFYYLAAHRPDDLARRLEVLGLPPDWEPVHVASYDYGPRWSRSGKARGARQAGETGGGVGRV